MRQAERMEVTTGRAAPLLPLAASRAYHRYGADPLKRAKSTGSSHRSPR